MTLTFGSLFAGIGGFDLGFQKAGMECCWQVEKNPACQRVLRRHWPDVAIFGDVTECGQHDLSPVDVICFGSPCQDISKGGSRKGLYGEKSIIFFEAIRIIQELRPSLAIWENVPTTLSSNNGDDFRAVLQAFRECGACDIGWRVLDAESFGVPQRRRRIFLVADFGGERAGEILFESESGSGCAPASACQGRKDTCGTGTGVGSSGAAETELTVFDWQSGGGVWLGVNNRRVTALQAKQTPAIFGPFGVRRVTHLERERLQGFPDHWTSGEGSEDRYHMTGNAVNVKVSEWLGRRIVRYVEDYA